MARGHPAEAPAAVQRLVHDERRRLVPLSVRLFLGLMVVTDLLTLRIDPA